jgi:DNA polymerase III subunit gamma/tau
LALDTKYRPRGYDDVLGQESAKAVLRQYVKEGKGFHQSYVFCGQHGSGKTTMGRILARALLCTNPQDGNPCDECHSCKVFLTPGATHESFEELDAASKSKAEDLQRIVDDIQYGTFSGKRRIYLFDESHQLSKKALDILLKPMEDNVEGSEDKKLVCIFCTTEPDKMRSTIFSRCAPAFVIQIVSAEVIADRLAWVCDQEGVAYDKDALVAIAELGECHIRDALKTVEGVSMLGPVNRDNVFSYLQLGANTLALDILEAIGSDLPGAVEAATEMSKAVSPSAAYERLAEAAMTAYRTHLGVGKIPLQWSEERIRALSRRGELLLGIASRFSAPPHRPTRHTLVLDVGTVHYASISKTPPGKVAGLVLEVKGAPSDPKIEAQVSVEGTIEEQKLSRAAGTVTSSAPPSTEEAPPIVASNPAPEPARIEGGVWIDKRGIGPGPNRQEEVRPATPPNGGGAPTASSSSAVEGALHPDLFRALVHHHMQELMRGRKGQSG